MSIFASSQVIAARKVRPSQRTWADTALLPMLVRLAIPVFILLVGVLHLVRKDGAADWLGILRDAALLSLLGVPLVYLTVVRPILGPLQSSIRRLSAHVDMLNSTAIVAVTDA